MQIIYIGAFRFPTYDAGAARVLNMARAMRALGHEVTFIAWGGKYENEESEDGDEYDGFRYYISGELNERRILPKIKGKFAPGARSIEMLRQRIEKVDVVVAYNPPYRFNCQLIRLCREHNVRYAADINEWYANNELKITDYLPNWLNMTRVNRTRVKNLILISTYLDRYYSESHNVVVPAMCNADDGKWHTERPDAEPREAVTLIYAGNPVKKDKVHEVINAVERVETTMPGKVRLMVLGIDRTTYIARYGKWLDNRDISDAIEFVGRVKQDDVPKYYARADFMVLLRDQTRKSNAGFPTKFAESMMSGTPVIANLTSDLGRYLTEGSNGYVVAAPTADALCEVLCSKIIGLDRARVDELHDNAKATGMSAFDYRTYIPPMNDFLNHLQ